MAASTEPYPTQRAEEVLAQFPLPPAGSKPPRREVRVGETYQRIVEYAEQEGIDLIVMGTHGRTGVSRLLMGSVAENVVRHAPCPVLLARAQAASEEALQPATEPLSS